jgi:hypothetical protein
MHQIPQPKTFEMELHFQFGLTRPDDCPISAAMACKEWGDLDGGKGAS